MAHEFKRILCTVTDDVVQEIHLIRQLITHKDQPPSKIVVSFAGLVSVMSRVIPPPPETETRATGYVLENLKFVSAHGTVKLDVDDLLGSNEFMLMWDAD